jgi:hypothetical protein
MTVNLTWLTDEPHTQIWMSAFTLPLSPKSAYNCSCVAGEETRFGLCHPPLEPLPHVDSDRVAPLQGIVAGPALTLGGTPSLALPPV